VLVQDPDKVKTTKKRELARHLGKPRGKGNCNGHKSGRMKESRRSAKVFCGKWNGRREETRTEECSIADRDRKGKYNTSGGPHHQMYSGGGRDEHHFIGKPPKIVRGKGGGYQPAQKKRVTVVRTAACKREFFLIFVGRKKKKKGLNREAGKSHLETAKNGTNHNLLIFLTIAPIGKKKRTDA